MLTCVLYRYKAQLCLELKACGVLYVNTPPRDHTDCIKRELDSANLITAELISPYTLLELSNLLKPRLFTAPRVSCLALCADFKSVGARKLRRRSGRWRTFTPAPIGSKRACRHDAHAHGDANRHRVHGHARNGLQKR